MANPHYQPIGAAKGKEHDDALLEVKIDLLKKIKNSQGSGVIKDLAESYALISGFISGSTTIEAGR